MDITIDRGSTAGGAAVLFYHILGAEMKQIYLIHFPALADYASSSTLIKVQTQNEQASTEPIFTLSTGFVM